MTAPPNIRIESTPETRALCCAIAENAFDRIEAEFPDQRDLVLMVAALVACEYSDATGRDPEDIGRVIGYLAQSFLDDVKEVQAQEDSA